MESRSGTSGSDLLFLDPRSGAGQICKGAAIAAATTAKSCISLCAER